MDTRIAYPNYVGSSCNSGIQIQLYDCNCSNLYKNPSMELLNCTNRNRSGSLLRKKPIAASVFRTRFLLVPGFKKGSTAATHDMCAFGRVYLSSSSRRVLVLHPEGLRLSTAQRRRPGRGMGEVQSFPTGYPGTRVPVCIVAVDSGGPNLKRLI
eukprot:3937547-Rhodomonas_salina.1